MLRYPNKVTVVVALSTWRRIDETCSRLGINKSHFMRFVVLPASTDYMDTTRDFNPTHSFHPFADERTAQGPTRAITLMLSDELYEVARRYAAKNKVSLPQLMRDMAAEAMDALDRDPELRIPSMQEIEAKATSLLIAMRADRSPQGPATAPRKDTIM